MNEEGVNQTYAYDGYTATYAYDTSPSPMPKWDLGLPAQDPPKPPQSLDTDEPKIIDRKNDR